MKKLITLFVAAAAVSSSAMAVSFSGEVSFSQVPGSSVNWDQINDNIDFTTNSAGVNGAVTSVVGDFTDYLAIGSFATFEDFDYDADFATGVIWSAFDQVTSSAAEISFTMTSIDNVVESLGLLDTLLVHGSGFITDDGAVIPVNAEFTFTANGSSTFSWSSTTSVPDESSTVTLLGLGLAGLGAIVRRRK